MKQPAEPRKKFNQLNGSEKLAFFGKLVIFLVTFGFAFPLLLSGD